jgi:hypothetical protein
MDTDLTVYTRRPAAEARCRACQAQRQLHARAALEDRPEDLEDLPRHTCRRPPAEPQDTRAAHQRAAQALDRDRELDIRRRRMIEIRAGRA